MQIEHNPKERRQPWWLWWVVWIVIAVFWLLQIRHGFNWDQIILGLFTGLALGLWAMDLTGGEVPESWRSKPSRRR